MGDNRKNWWDYVAYIHENCRGQANELCSMTAHKELGMDFAATKKCVDGSFNKPFSEYNKNSPDLVNNLID